MRLCFAAPLVFVIVLISQKLRFTNAETEFETSYQTLEEICDARVEEAYGVMDDIFNVVSPVELEKNLPPGFELLQGFGPQLLTQSPALLRSCLSLLRTNMEKIYDESQFFIEGAETPGWHDEPKWKELIAPDAFHIIVKKTQPSCEQPPTTPVGESVGSCAKPNDEEVVAFLHIRFLPGDSEETCCTLYLYEIQLDKSVQGKGLGFRLMKFVKQVAVGANADVVQLTVQKANPRAFAFYTKKCGFTIVQDYKDTWELEWFPDSHEPKDN